MKIKKWNFDISNSGSILNIDNIYSVRNEIDISFIRVEFDDIELKEGDKVKNNEETNRFG